MCAQPCSKATDPPGDTLRAPRPPPAVGATHASPKRVQRRLPSTPAALFIALFIAQGLCLQNIAVAAEPPPPCPDDEETEWLDSSHCYITSRADNIAVWMNDFFGNVRTEEEAPYSTLRLRFDQEWSENNQFDSDIKLRGKLHLPALNKRLSLLFSEEDADATGNDDLLIDKRDTPDNVSLQYEARKRDRYRVDFRVGLRSSLYPKVSVRYRYEYPLQDTLLGTFSEELLYLGDDGFAAKTRIEFDKILAEDKLLQWHNKVDWEEELQGVVWSSSLSLDKKLSGKRAIGYYVAVTGQSQPSDYVSDYSVGVRYRQNIFRPWLFAELQPSYRWSKPAPGLPRENAVVILFRLEAVFKRQFGAKDE